MSNSARLRRDECVNFFWPGHLGDSLLFGVVTPAHLHRCTSEAPATLVEVSLDLQVAYVKSKSDWGM